MNQEIQEKQFCPYCGSSTESFDDFEGKKRQRCIKCGAVLYENPIPATALIIPQHDDPYKIILVKRAVEPCKGQYSLPGGFMEIDESPEECALREMLEETSLEGRIKRLLGVKNQPSQLYKMVILVGYEMEIIGGKLDASDDAEEAEFFPFDNHPPIAFETHQWLVDNYELQITNQENEELYG